jgi:hypothetical protein
MSQNSWIICNNVLWIYSIHGLLLSYELHCEKGVYHLLFPMAISSITCCNADGHVKLYVSVIVVMNVKMLREVLTYYSITRCDKN